MSEPKKEEIFEEPDHAKRANLFIEETSKLENKYPVYIKIGNATQASIEADQRMAQKTKGTITEEIYQQQALRSDIESANKTSVFFSLSGKDEDIIRKVIGETRRILNKYHGHSEEQIPFRVIDVEELKTENFKPNLFGPKTEKTEDRFFVNDFFTFQDEEE